MGRKKSKITDSNTGKSHAVADVKPERHASSGPLTDKEIRNASPWSSDYQMAEPGGLRIIIKTNGAKWWRFRYRFQGIEKQLSMGVYPEVSLAEARKACNEAKVLIVQGIDPLAKRRLDKESLQAAAEPPVNTFEKIGREWYAGNKEAWSVKYAEKVMLRLEKYIFPKIGGIPIADLKTVDYAALVKEIEAKNHIETAHRVAQFCAQISRYACAAGIIEYDMASSVSRIIKKVKENHFATIVTPREFGHLLADIASYDGSPSIRYAIRIMPYVFVRSGELRGALWQEIDLERAEWIIPPERMKMNRPHVVPLAPQVVRLFDEMRGYSGAGDLVFPGYASRNRCITDVALLNVLRRLGYDRDKMTIHGFRSAASTMLNEMGYNRDWIEMQLAHAEKNSVRDAYNRAQWLPERRKMMVEWADYIDGLRDKANGGKNG